MNEAGDVADNEGRLGTGAPAVDVGCCEAETEAERDKEPSKELRGDACVCVCVCVCEGVRVCARLVGVTENELERSVGDTDSADSPVPLIVPVVVVADSGGETAEADADAAAEPPIETAEELKVKELRDGPDNGPVWSLVVLAACGLIPRVGEGARVVCACAWLLGPGPGPLCLSTLAKPP